jgi:hypothetical protein
MCAMDIGLFVVAKPCSSINFPSVVGTTNGEFWIKYFSFYVLIK